MADQLTTTTRSQSQTTAQVGNLQPTDEASSTAANANAIQPETANALLTSPSQQGVPLQATSASQVYLSKPAPAPKHTAKPVHHANTVFLGFSVLLLVVAVILFWTTSRSVKSTT